MRSANFPLIGHGHGKLRKGQTWSSMAYRHGGTLLHDQMQAVMRHQDKNPRLLVYPYALFYRGTWAQQPKPGTRLTYQNSILHPASDAEIVKASGSQG